MSKFHTPTDEELVALSEADLDMFVVTYVDPLMESYYIKDVHRDDPRHWNVLEATRFATMEDFKQAFPGEARDYLSVDRLRRAIALEKRRNARV